MHWGSYAGIILCRKNWHAGRDSRNYRMFIGIVAGCMAALALAFIENILVVLTPLGAKNVCFTLPLLGLLLALLVISSRHLKTINE